MDNIHRFRNNQKAIPIGNQGWDKAHEQHLIDLKVKVSPNGSYRERETGHEFVNLCACGYLGLQNHPAVIDGAIDALRSERVINTPISRTRMHLAILADLEAELSDLYRARAMTALSASATIAGVLPLIASGHLAGGPPPVMVFDKFCHFSMNHMKPVCADETLVLTAPHNDLDYLEDVCKKHPHVAYVADGVYSTGGAAPVKELLELQDRYGLFLFFDDSHSLAAWGGRGEGYVRTHIPEMNPRTAVVCSLNKAFGGSGGVAMVATDEQVTLLSRFGGPMIWSQHLPVASIGADLASARLQRTPELALRQKRLQENVALFDSLVDTAERGDGFAIRLVRIGSEEGAVEGSKEMMERGFYTSAVFFPVVERGRAGLRIMLRADHDPADVLAFCEAVREFREAAVVRG